MDLRKSQKNAGGGPDLAKSGDFELVKNHILKFPIGNKIISFKSHSFGFRKIAKKCRRHYTSGLDAARCGPDLAHFLPHPLMRMFDASGPHLARSGNFKLEENFFLNNKITKFPLGNKIISFKYHFFILCKLQEIHMTKVRRDTRLKS